MSIDEIFAKLNLNQELAKTYVTLLESGLVTAGNLAKRLNVPRSSLYGFLSVLAENGLVRQSEKQGVKVWQAETPDKISALLDAQLNTWQQTKFQFLNLLPALQTKQAHDLIRPRFHYYEGAEGVKHVLKDMLLYRDLDTEAFWPIERMIDILGEDFFVYLNVRRIKQNLYTRAIWPKGKTVETKKYPFLGVGKEFKREIRIAPSSIDCTMGYWAYGDKVAFISSRQESFGSIVESRELRQMLKSQFEVIWNISKPIKVNPRDTAEFLQMIK